MRKPCYYIVLFCSSFILFAFHSEAQQLKLGNNPTFIESSAVLQLDSKNQGLLLTRIPDTSAINTFIPPDGMIIYFTDSNKITNVNYGPNAGVYERKNGKWQRLLFAGDGSYWSMTGNSGTVPGTNFLGTTDSQPLVFKVQGTQAGYVGINSNYNTSFGLGSVVSSQFATAIGGYDSATNSYAAALGYQAAASGQYTTAIGSIAKASNSYATTLGYNSIASGQYTTAIGSFATASNTYSTALGYQASSSGQYATAIGYNALAPNNNTIILGNTTGNVMVGIGLNNPTNTLTITSPTANTSGLQLTNLTSASPVDSTSGLIGVDATGNVVRAPGVLKTFQIFNSTSPTRPLNFAYQVSPVAAAFVTYSINLSFSSFATAGTAEADLQISSTSGGPWNTISTVNYVNGSGGPGKPFSETMTISGMIQAGYWVQIVGTSSGSGSVSFVNGEEVILQ